MKSWSKSLNRIFETKNKESDKETKTLNGEKVVKLHLIAKELEKRVNGENNFDKPFQTTI